MRSAAVLFSASPALLPVAARIPVARTNAVSPLALLTILTILVILLLLLLRRPRRSGGLLGGVLRLLG